MTPQRPNILLIITDHIAFHGHVDTGRFDYTWPVWNEFCRQGVRFDRAYSVSPMCTAARASIMSGIYPSRHGLRWNSEDRFPPNLTDFRSGQMLYSHYLAQAGYRNAYVGKWHCGAERLPIDYGIEGWSLPEYGKPYMSDEYKRYAGERGFGDARVRFERSLNHPEWRGETITLHDPSPWKFMDGSGVFEGPPEAHESFFVAHLAQEKIKELASANQPFSLVASFWGPHQAYFPTEPFAGMIDPASIPEYPTFNDDLAGRPFRHWIHRFLSHGDCRANWPDWSIWRQVAARAYEQALQTDAAIGRILQSLEDSGQADNTIVLWVADHGDALGSHGGVWDKSSTYTEEVGRVPFAIRWPKGFDPGAGVPSFVTNMDVTATMLDAAGVSVPSGMDSRSLLPLCRAPESPWPDELVCEHHGRIDRIPLRVIYNGQYKYVAALFDDGDELYDLQADPHEVCNLIDAPERADVRRELRARLIRHIERVRGDHGERDRFLLKLRIAKN